jgi:hypothetical protein
MINDDRAFVFELISAALKMNATSEQLHLHIFCIVLRGGEMREVGDEGARDALNLFTSRRKMVNISVFENTWKAFSGGERRRQVCWQTLEI